MRKPEDEGHHLGGLVVVLIVLYLLGKLAAAVFDRADQTK